MDTKLSREGDMIAQQHFRTASLYGHMSEASCTRRASLNKRYLLDGAQLRARSLFLDEDSFSPRSSAKDMLQETDFRMKHQWQISLRISILAVVNRKHHLSGINTPDGKRKSTNDRRPGAETGLCTRPEI
jgi:hypothetical protein